MQTGPSAAFKRGVTLDNTLFYMGNLMTFNVEHSATNGRFAFVDTTGKPGNEPPPHYHLYENEMYYVLEGAMRAYCGDQVLTVGAGESLFIPQGMPHALKFLTPRFRTLIMVSAVGEHAVGLDSFFRAMAEPATSLDLPEGMKTYAVTNLDQVIQTSIANGTIMLTPEQTAQALPHYPGFGSEEHPSK